MAGTQLNQEQIKAKQKIKEALNQALIERTRAMMLTGKQLNHQQYQTNIKIKEELIKT